MKTKRRDAPASPSVQVTAGSPPGRGTGHAHRWLLTLVVVSLLVVAGWLAVRAWMAAAPSDERAATSSAAAGTVAHVPNAQCLECHPQQAAQWQDSHHAQAMALPTPATVRANFNNTEFRHGGVTTRFFRKGDAFMVRTDGPDGKLADFEIKYTFGVEPLQQYLIAMPGGRLQPLSIAWEVARQRWYRLQPHEKTPAGDVLHWTGRYQTANTMCVACHTTAFEKRYDAATDRFDSRWAEMNVSCQACHGPGERHVAWARQPDRPGPGAPAPGPRYGLVADTGAAQTGGNTDICAPCHSRRSELMPTHLPGRPLYDDQQPSTLRAGLYHPDGQQLDEVYVYGSFRQSRMYQKGVSCTHCHNPHTGKLVRQGNGLCLQCHQETANPSFAGAAGNYDTPAHHMHPAGSAGAQCVNCHMPARTYMGIQPRPDHSLRVPRPDLSLKLGTPNACNGCHADKSAQWAVDALAVRRRDGRTNGSHYGEALAAARAGLTGAAQGLVRLVADPQLAAIVRATALEELAAEPSIGASERVAATRDSDPQVRAAAAASVEGLPPQQRMAALAPLLSDPVRAVRIGAARSLSSVPAAQFDPAARPGFEAALAEYVSAQNISLDTPGARLNLAVVQENTGQREAAQQHYLAALKIDPDFTPARLNLARMYSEERRITEAEGVLQDGLARNPDIGEMNYSLGLVLAQSGQLAKAANALERAARLMPQRARVRYNLGLALQQLGRRPAAEQALLAAQRLDASDPAIPYALAAFYLQGGQPSKAGEWIVQLEQLVPGDRRLDALKSALAARQSDSRR